MTDKKGANIKMDATAHEKLDFSDGSIRISPRASGKEAQAAKELQTYLYSISQKKLAIREVANGRTNGRPAIIVGTVKSLTEVAGGFQEQLARLKTGSDEAFDLYIGRHGGAPTALILANEPIGALYGAYTFLEKFGIGFYLAAMSFRARMCGCRSRRWMSSGIPRCRYAAA